MINTETQFGPQDVSFEQYVDMLSRYESPAATFHRIGVDNQDIFAYYARQESTVAIDNMPSLLTLEEADGLVDAHRVEQLVARIAEQETQPSIYVGIVPLQHIAANYEQIRAALGEGRHYVVAEYDAETPRASEIQDRMPGRIHPLIHPETGTEAAYNFFQVTVKNRHPETLAHQASLHAAIEKAGIPQIRPVMDGSTLNVRSGGQLQPHEAQQLWQLFDTRFGDISANMPKNLAESEDETHRLLYDPRYHIVFKTEQDGSINCAALLTDVPDAYPWINPAFVEAQQDRLAANPQTTQAKTIFVPGLAAYQEAGQRASKDVLQTIADIGIAAGAPMLAYQFECTDVSSLYIPKIVAQNLAVNPGTELRETELLAQKKFVIAEIG